MRSLIATRSSAVNTLNFLLIDVVFLADFCVSFFGLMEVPDWESSSVPLASLRASRSRFDRIGLIPSQGRTERPEQM